MGRINKELIRHRIEESAHVKRRICTNDSLIEMIDAISNEIIQALRSERKVILFGNGGSAADAQHMAAELMGKYYQVRPSLPALALTTNTSVLTALGNDFSFDQIFAKQLEGVGQPGDVAIGISTSGRSTNVLEGIKSASKRQLITVCLTGANGGQAQEMVDYCLRVPSEDTPRIQEAHITILHIICEIVEGAMFP